MTLRNRAELPRRLNLGCGEDRRAGWLNVDIDPSVGPDEVVDLSATPWDYPDSHFERIDARHVLEHLAPVPWDELERILAPDGRLVVTYPIGHTRFEDATHRQFWNVNTAEHVAGERVHAHEEPTTLALVDRDLEWWISNAEPLVRLYTRYRLALRGPGAWLEQIPGLYGEVTATFAQRGDRGGE